MYDAEIQKLKEHIDLYLFEPRLNWPTYYIEERSYARWIAYEFLEKLLPLEGMSEAEFEYRTMSSPDEILTEYITQMDELSEISTNQQSANIFMMARDSLYNLLYIFDIWG